MKRATALLLLALIVFNWGGYRILFYFLEQQSVSFLLSEINSHRYNENDLIELSIPLDIPYQHDQTNFERVDGDIMIDGEYFHYVKRKVAGNRLIIKCLRNAEKLKLVENAREVTGALQESSETDHAKSSGLVKKIKSAVSEYESAFHHITTSGINIDRCDFFTSNSTICNGGFHFVPEIPPELHSA